MFQFKAAIEIIGINPFVFVPEPILNGIFQQANKDKGPIPIKGTVNGKVYKQTLVKYRDAWRLYINTTMLANSPKRIGEIIELTIAFDPEERSLTPHPKLVQAFAENAKAKAVFDTLRPSLQLEIVRYIANLKTEESIEKNVIKAIGFLLGENRFVGREKP
ncbi:YdeI/OmpD-associated family protein [Adhaeribacter terreus]|uniref:YdeI/OmpD-associated family protein n=1 Tax=Adhaeribacter terreus TaxID=529703 RepID=A0ABW0E5Z0_9BACT